MLCRELSDKEPLGGINADAMGLGKTLEALATVTLNPPNETDLLQGRKVTLWVGPKGSHDQVREAIRKFCCSTRVSKVLIYNRPELSKIHGDGLETFLQEQDLM